MRNSTEVTPAVPAGWKLVPIEPTEEMKVAGCDHDDPLGRLVDWQGKDVTTREVVAGVFGAMIAAAPTPVDHVVWLQTVAPEQLQEALSLLPSVMRPSLSNAIIAAINEQAAIIERMKRTSHARKLAFEAAMSQAAPSSDGKPASPAWWQDEEAAEREFTEYFCRNYPGPDTVISKPEWHAPKLFRAAKHALLATVISRPPVVDPKTCPGADDPEERCPRHPSECVCWVADPGKKRKQATFKLPPLGDELYENYPAMSAQTHEELVKEYARTAIRAALASSEGRNDG